MGIGLSSYTYTWAVGVPGSVAGPYLDLRDESASDITTYSSRNPQRPNRWGTAPDVAAVDPGQTSE
jgi:hypothetical protein